MRRRDFLAGLAGTTSWPGAVRGQQFEKVRRIGVLVGTAADDPESQARVAAFKKGLQQLGWAEGRNVQLDIHWATTNTAEIRRHAAELAAVAPDVILPHGGGNGWSWSTRL